MLVAAADLVRKPLAAELPTAGDVLRCTTCAHRGVFEHDRTGACGCGERLGIFA